MDVNLFCTLVYQAPIKLPVQSPRKLWQYLHSPQRMDDFQSFYASKCNPENLFELQRFILLTRSFSSLNELELVQLFQLFDLFKIQKLDCQSVYLIYDLLLANALNCRQLYLYNYQATLIPYLQNEQNSPYILKSKLFQMLFLMNVSSTEIFAWGAMIEDQAVQVGIQIGVGYLYKCVRGIEGEIV
ncbi:Conserved_hypothetical protein [Hexamita inflata]|uniref:Uncharacterized protein n=1 Tax=Hexamita inflata TaxID=28002 RepID=A0AA86TS71_9EUKA|nr:Conserved hypothetical protein [Hexamita inflata]